MELVDAPDSKSGVRKDVSVRVRPPAPLYGKHMNHSFFTDISGFTEFAQACEDKYYHPVPEDWCVVVTDVEGSTQAIQSGRYKDVNMLGAACITVVVGCCKGVNIPYVFGGDGATFLIPSEYVEEVKAELVAVKKLAQSVYNLSLRIGFVPVKEITDRGKNFSVAKYLMPTGLPLAMFGGGGAALADDLVKNEGFAVEADEGDKEPDLSALSCRWEPIKSQKGKILTLLIMAVDGRDDYKTYNEVNASIEKILDEKSSPVKKEMLVYKWPSFSALRDAKIVWKQSGAALKILNHIILIGFFNIANRINLKIGAFDVHAYRDDMITNSDYRKFDDMLRMVVDCSAEQIKEIENILDNLKQQKKIVYGMHESDSALMTCFVSSLESTGHIHFIDGNDGGYAIAAKQLKQQLSQLDSQSSAA